MRPPAMIVLIWLAVKAGVSALGMTGIDYLQFDVPGARLTRPFGVNASGQIVGLYRDSGNASHGFVRNPDGSYVTIDYPGAVFTNATGINARGDIVGRWTDVAGINHGYQLTAQGQFVSVDPPAPCIASALQAVIHGINDVRDLVGRCFDVNGKQLGWVWRHDGSFQILDDPGHPTTDAWLITNQGEVVGDYSDAALFVHGYTWTADLGLLTLDFPGHQTGIRGMNARGDLTGIYLDAGGRLHGFLLRDGVFETVDYPGSVNGGGTLVISNLGLIVGGYIDGAGREHGFMAR